MGYDSLGFYSVVGHGRSGQPQQSYGPTISWEERNQRNQAEAREERRQDASRIPATLAKIKAAGNNCTLPDKELFSLLSAWQDIKPYKLLDNRYYKGKEDPTEMKKQAGGRLFLGLMDRGHFDFWLTNRRPPYALRPTFQDCIATIPPTGQREQSLQQQINRVSFRLRNQWPFGGAGNVPQMPNERARDIVAMADFFGVADLNPQPIIDPPRFDF
jgi:hypothetical protein